MPGKRSSRKENEESNFTKEATDLFGTTDLYEILNLKKKTAGPAEKIKKAYYKASLKYHPDRVNNRLHHEEASETKVSSSNGAKEAESDKDVTELATRKFQLIGKAYAILSDEEKRKIYDETGVIDDDSVISSERDWSDYWRVLFKKVTVKDLEDFEQNYKNSDEERNDLKAAYLKHEGDMTGILTEIMCTTQDEDEERLGEILKELISNEELPDFHKFSNESDKKKKARKRRADKEAREAAAAMEEIKAKNGSLAAGNDDDFLTKMIQKRQSDRGERMGSFLDQLGEKYSKKSSTGSKNKK